jgi:hypothetical protein
MSKKILYIVLGVALIILAGVGMFQFFKSKKNTDTSTPTSSATPAASEQPLFGDASNGNGQDSLFSGTPEPTANDTGSTLTVNSKGICPDQWAGQADADQDGLPDSVETIYKTDPANPDTDGDGYKDGDEIKNGYDPLKQGSAKLNSDNDGLTDNEECRWKTDPFNPDTDGDSFGDGTEIQNGFDPTIKGDGSGNDALPEKRAQMADAGLRPNRNSSNYTEGLAGVILGDTPLNQVGQVKVTSDQVRNTLATANLNLTLPETKISELNIQQTNTPADISAYLARIDTLSPTKVLDANNFSDSLAEALTGNTASIAAICTNLSDYENALLAVLTPPSAAQHMTLLVSVTRFLNERLLVIQQYGQSDPTKAYIATREIRESLAPNIASLSLMEQNLKRLAQ